MALNGALYAADKSDRIATIEMQMRDERATATIWSYAAMKAVAVAVTPLPAIDVLGASAVDATMVVTLAHVYGIRLTWVNAQQLITSIAKAAGWVMIMEAATHLAANLFVGLTLGTGKVLTAVPQGAAAGYGSFIVGQAAKYYFEHGASWGGEAPKSVVTRILEATDKQSVLVALAGRDSPQAFRQSAQRANGLKSARLAGAEKGISVRARISKRNLFDAAHSALLIVPPGPGGRNLVDPEHR